MASKFFRYVNGKVIEVAKSTNRMLPRYPLAIEAAAVHPSQIAESSKFDREHGVPTEYRGDGSPIVTGSRHYASYRKLHGLYDRNGFEQ